MFRFVLFYNLREKLLAVYCGTTCQGRLRYPQTGLALQPHPPSLEFTTLNHVSASRKPDDLGTGAVVAALNSGHPAWDTHRQSKQWRPGRQ